MKSIDSIAIATDGSESVARAAETAIDLASRFDAEVHAVYVVDTGEIEAAPNGLSEELAAGLRDRGERAVAEIEDLADRPVKRAVREGHPVAEISRYARENSVDIVTTGTRGRHGQNRFLIGSVAERLVRTCPVPVLTVRQLAEGEPAE